MQASKILALTFTIERLLRADTLVWMKSELKRATILLVEDSEEDAFFFKRALEKSGFNSELILASDGKAAISILSDPVIVPTLHAVFLDLKLPMVSGFDVLRWAKERNSDGTLRIFVLSGSSQAADRKMALELGALDYLVKPITREILYRLLSLGV